MDMRIEGGVSYAYEFNPMELVVDTHDIYKRSLEISRLESTEEKSKEDLARLEGLRRIKGYIGGYELDYRIEGFDFVRFGDCGDIQLLTFLSPLIDEHETPSRFFAPGEVCGIIKYQLEEGKGVGGKFELKIHEFDDSGDEFVSEDRFYTLHPIVTPIWEPYKVKRVKEALEENPGRELIELS
jgi:hypothetical protein